MNENTVQEKLWSRAHTKSAEISKELDIEKIFKTISIIIIFVFRIHV